MRKVFVCAALAALTLAGAASADIAPPPGYPKPERCYGPERDQTGALMRDRNGEVQWTHDCSRLAPLVSPKIVETCDGASDDAYLRVKSPDGSGRLVQCGKVKTEQQRSQPGLPR